MSKTRTFPYPKRLNALILSYQKNENPNDFKKILFLVDKLLIKVIHQVYKLPTYSYLRKYEADEIYHTAIIALSKALKTIVVDERFTIPMLCSRLNGFIGREFKMTFLKSSLYVGFEDIREGEEVNVQSPKPEATIEGIIDGIKLIKPKFPDRGIEAIKLHLISKMSLQEIADKMGVKKGCIRSWVDRGKKILRSMIDGERKKDLWH